MFHSGKQISATRSPRNGVANHEAMWNGTAEDMAKDKTDWGPPDDGGLDAALREQLKAIEEEETPERLLALAKELQRLLRETDQ